MVTINGEPKAAKPGASLSWVLEEYGFRPERIAVERNGAIVPRPAYGDTRLEDGDVLEIVNFVGGG